MSSIKSYSIQNAADAVTTQHLSLDKILISAEQALSLWSSVSAIRFKKLTQPGIEPEIPIRFINTHTNGQLGNGSGDINIGNRFFIDRYNEDFKNIGWGPFDLVGAIAHEIGHMLIGNHSENDASIMYPSFNEKQVKRFLFLEDIQRVQARYGVLRLGESFPCNLNNDTNVNVSSTNVQVFKSNRVVTLIGSDKESGMVIVSISKAKNVSINAVNISFTTLTPNVIVNSVDLFDGEILLQRYFICCQYDSDDMNLNPFSELKEWKVKLGLLRKRKIKTSLIIKIDIQFKRFDNRFQTGEFRLYSLNAEPLVEIAPLKPPIETR